VQYATALLSINLDHAAVKDTHSELQHYTAQLLMGVRSSACNEWQVVVMMVLQTPWCKESERVEEQVGNAEETLQEGQAAIAGAHDYDPGIHRDLALAEELLGHNGERLSLSRVSEHLLTMTLYRQSHTSKF